MTIAACYLSPEGIVLGADSTTTIVSPGGTPHFYNHAQKLFEIGHGSNFGVVTWGLGGLDVSSYRRLFALLGDDLAVNEPASVSEVSNKWIDLFWSEYSACALVKITASLAAKPPAGSGEPGERTLEEEQQFSNLRNNAVAGFCIAGYAKPDRSPSAFVSIFDPLAPKPASQELTVGSFYFWGAPNMIDRLMWGCDADLRANILASPHWAGTETDLDSLINGCFF